MCRNTNQIIYSLLKYLDNTILKMLHIEMLEISNTAIVLRFLLGFYGVSLFFTCLFFLIYFFLFWEF